DVLLVEPSLLQSQSLVKQLQRKKINFSRRVESPNLEVIRALTLAGCGVGILPTRVALNTGVADDSEPSQLQRYSSKAPVFKGRLWLIYRVGTQSRATGRAIVDAILSAKI